METETYKNAKLILERFDPEAKKKAVSPDFLRLPVGLFVFPVWIYALLFLQELESTPVRPHITPRPGQGTPPFSVQTLSTLKQLNGFTKGTRVLSRDPTEGGSHETNTDGHPCFNGNDPPAWSTAPHGTRRNTCG